MTNKRTNTITVIIKASPENIYNALIDPAAIEKWRAQDGMQCMIYEFDPQPGGIYRMALEYKAAYNSRKVVRRYGYSQGAVS